MYFVYILRSISHRDQTYVGFTEDLDARLKKHNEGGNVSTAPYRPWKLIFYCAFEDKSKALSFETYLKSHLSILATTALTEPEERHRADAIAKIIELPAESLDN